jgi:hypothetical protein
VIGKGLYAIGNLAIGGVHEHETWRWKVLTCRRKKDVGPR